MCWVQTAMRPTASIEAKPLRGAGALAPFDVRRKGTLKDSLRIARIKKAIASILLLGTGFVLGQKLSSVPTTTAQPIVSKQTNILPVKTTVIEPVSSYTTTQTYTGEVAALRTSEVGFERGGKLVEVLVEEGDRISLDAPFRQFQRRKLLQSASQHFF